MRVALVQGTWSKDAAWWKDTPGSFAEAIRKKGHSLINGRPFNWDTELGGIGFGDEDLWGWEAAGRHLWDRLDPPCCHGIDPNDLCIIGHSHARQVIKFACHMGLKAAKVILVSGPVRKDVDERTVGARASIGKLICLSGGKEDRWQWLGHLFDGRLGVIRKDPEADEWYRHMDADHSSFLNKPEQFDYVLRHL